MGCWGTGIFENDQALDWINVLEESDGLSVVSDVLLAQVNEDYIDADDATELLAAAEVVAALLGQPSAALPIEVARWIAEHRGLDPRPYRELALNHARAVLSGNSELRELWAENEPEYPFWKATVEALIARLSSVERHHSTQ